MKTACGVDVELVRVCCSESRTVWQDGREWYQGPCTETATVAAVDHHPKWVQWRGKSYKLPWKKRQYAPLCDLHAENVDHLIPIAKYQETKDVKRRLNRAVCR